MGGELKGRQAEAQVRTHSIRDMVLSNQFKNNLAKIVPGHVNGERFAVVALRTLSTMPKLMECTPESVVGSFMQAGALGLELGVNGEAWLIPYKGEAQLQIGYLGQLKLAWNSGMIAAVQADVVTHKEVESGAFDYQRGTDPYIRHKPMADRDLEEDDVAYVYAIVWLKGSTIPIWDVLDYKGIQRIRAVSKSPNSPAWMNHYAEQAKAKVLKRTLKLVPKSREQATAISVDDQADAAKRQTFDLDPDMIDSIVGVRPPIDITPKKPATPESSEPEEEDQPDPPRGPAAKSAPPISRPARNDEPIEEDDVPGWD